jgi:hypothetical protein
MWRHCEIDITLERLCRLPRTSGPHLHVGIRSTDFLRPSLFSAQLPITVTARLDWESKGSVCSRKSRLASRYLSAEKPVDDHWAPRGARRPADAEVSMVIGKPIPRLDSFLSGDRLCYDTNRLLGIEPCLPSQPPIRS